MDDAIKANERAIAACEREVRESLARGARVNSERIAAFRDARERAEKEREAKRCR